MNENSLGWNLYQAVSKQNTKKEEKEGNLLLLKIQIKAQCFENKRLLSNRLVINQILAIQVQWSSQTFMLLSLHLFRFLDLVALVHLYVGVLERVKRQFLTIDQVGFQKLLEGRLRQLRLEGHIARFFVMIDHQASSLLLQVFDFFLKLRVAVKINLIELVFIDEVNGDILEVIIGSPIGSAGVCEQKCAFLVWEGAYFSNLIGSCDFLDRLVHKFIHDFFGFQASDLNRAANVFVVVSLEVPSHKCILGLLVCLVACEAVLEIHLQGLAELFVGIFFDDQTLSQSSEELRKSDRAHVAVPFANSDNNKVLLDPSCHGLQKLILGKGFEVKLIIRQVKHQLLFRIIDLKHFCLISTHIVHVLEKSSVDLLQHLQFDGITFYCGDQDPTIGSVQKLFNFSRVIRSHNTLIWQHLHLMKEDIVSGLFKSVWFKKILDLLIALQ